MRNRMHGIIIRGENGVEKHSFYDYKALLQSAVIGYPTEQKITAKIPYSNETFDFSYLYNGKKFYNDRTLSFVFALTDRDRVILADRQNRFINWVMSGNGRKPVIYTKMPEYYFNAEFTDFSVEYTLSTICKITVNFTAYPFRIPVNPNSGLTEVV